MRKKIVATMIAAILIFACTAAVLADCPPHTFGLWGLILEPTCTHWGQKQAVCSECGLLYGDREPIPPLGHLPGDWEVAFSPTLNEDGWQVIQCLRCHIILEGKPIPKLRQKNGSIACSEGPRFQETRPGLTNKWYMYTPLDLSAEGKRTIPLIATNHYIIGSVLVTTEGGNVTVTYQLNSTKIDVKKEFMTFFPDIGSVQTIELNALASQNFPFGIAVNIQKNLARDMNVLLYIALTIDYDILAPGIKPYGAGGVEEDSAVVESAFILPEIDASDLSQYHSLKIGTVDPDVQKLKLRLFELGYYKRINDNKTYTQATAEAVMAFQKANGLTSNGIASPETQAALYSDLAIPNPK